ncbi:hypothetical protein I6A60_20820 [Frankia sp. AgB1.9]|uniref:hypothetical protein n=1 Tax=unclassified Frankia TaxID=2632575 RepID=UPI001931DB10|nr:MULTISPECIES: hypothetical protein [unclassified Frankia]MBL7490953.1 hypothetical protein [Frankia sp. AgW1.1]MBL7550299.1 hypothetical protein [Frankia sp. AgB1.9]MBL7619136.1 hypothetical protein [Frankia sp. AgB1.8]
MDNLSVVTTTRDDASPPAPVDPPPPEPPTTPTVAETTPPGSTVAGARTAALYRTPAERRPARAGLARIPGMRAASWARWIARAALQTARAAAWIMRVTATHTGLALRWSVRRLVRLAGLVTAGVAGPARLARRRTRVTRTALARIGRRIERGLDRRLGVTLRSPGLGGRIFLTTTGGAVLLIAFGSVVLGVMGGGPAALRPLLPTPSASPVVVAATTPAPPPVTEFPGVPIAATRTFLLSAFAAGSGHPTAVTTASGGLPVGRMYRHVPRRGDDHLLTGELVFPLLPAPLACVAQVQLRLTMLAAEGTVGDEGPYPLGVYPSALTGLARGLMPARVPTLDLVANRPRGDFDWTPYSPPNPAGDGDSVALAAAGQPGAAGQPAATATTPREITADVTDLYTRWVEGMPTAKGRPGIRPDTPLVLAVRPEQTNAIGNWQHTYGGSDTATPPVLLWTRRVHCR